MLRRLRDYGVWLQKRHKTKVVWRIQAHKAGRIDTDSQVTHLESFSFMSTSAVLFSKDLFYTWGKRPWKRGGGWYFSEASIGTLCDAGIFLFTRELQCVTLL